MKPLLILSFCASLRLPRAHVRISRAITCFVAKTELSTILLRQKACDRVEIDRTVTYLGKTSAVETQVFTPDGKPHGKRGTISRWVGDRLQIGQVGDRVYYGIDSSRNLHMSDGRAYPQCNGPCDEVAEKVNWPRNSTFREELSGVMPTAIPQSFVYGRSTTRMWPVCRS